MTCALLYLLYWRAGGLTIPQNAPLQQIRGGGAPAIPTPIPTPSPILNGGAALSAPAAAASLPSISVIPTLAPAIGPAPAVQAPLPALSASPLSSGVLVEEKRVPVRGVMRQMVKSMTASLSIPHFGYQDEVSFNATER